MRCRNCGAEVDPGEEYCPECGARLVPRTNSRTREVAKMSRSELEELEAEREYRHRKRTLRRIAHLIGVLLAFVVFLGGFYYGYKKVFGDRDMGEMLQKFGILSEAEDMETDEETSSADELDVEDNSISAPEGESETP
jgi:predicted nucleic acid-binding Zn ribbon protein